MKVLLPQTMARSEIFEYFFNVIIINYFVDPSLCLIQFSYCMYTVFTTLNYLVSRIWSENLDPAEAFDTEELTNVLTRHVQKSYCFLGHYCLEHSKQFSDKYYSDITSSVCLFHCLQAYRYMKQLQNNIF